jgi:hypothetical protein
MLSDLTDMAGHSANSSLATFNDHSAGSENGTYSINDSAKGRNEKHQVLKDPGGLLK